MQNIARIRTGIQWVPLLTAVLAVGLWIGCTSRADQTHRERTIPVKTAPVLRGKMALPVQASGMLAARSEMRLSFKVGGIVRRLEVEEGATVRAGQRLAALDQAEIQAQVMQARRSLEKAERDLQRIRNLHRDRVATLEQLQDATTARDVAAAQLQIAEFNQRHSEIYAPTAGRILRRFVERNELVAAGTPIYAFGATARGWVVRAGVAERDLVRLQTGDSARVRFDAYPGMVFSARVSEVAEALDPRSGTFEVELALDPTDRRLASGFVATVDIFPSTRDSVALVPVEAVVEADGAQGIVYTLIPESPSETAAQPGSGSAILRARRIAVTIAHIVGDRVAVAQGLENVGIVITDGAPYLVDGSAVRVINAL